MKIVKAIESVVENLTGFLLLVMFFVVTINVFARYLFSHPFFWSEELARYLMFYMVMLGSSIAIRDDVHPSLTFVVEKFPKRFQKIWSYVIVSSILIISVLILYEGYKMVLGSKFLKTPAMRISFSWVYMGLPIGGALMTFECVLKLIEPLLQKMKEGKTK